MVNAIYFKGQWQLPFQVDEKGTVAAAASANVMFGSAIPLLMPIILLCF